MDSCGSWNTQTGEPLVRVNHGAPIRDLALSPDGRFLATAAGEAARVWDLGGNGRLVRALPHPFAVEGVSFDPAGGALMTIARDARVFDVAIVAAAGAARPAGQHHRGGVRALRVARLDGRARRPRHDLGLARAGGAPAPPCAAWGGCARRSPGAHRATSSRRRAPTTEPASFASTTAISSPSLPRTRIRSTGSRSLPTESTIATSSLDGSARIWAGALYARSEALLGHRSPIQPSGTSSSRRTDASSRRATTGPRASGSTRSTRSQSLSAARRPPGELSHSARDGGLIVTAGLDATIRFWRRNGTQVRSFAHPGTVVDLAVSPDGLLLLTAGQDGTARLWRFADGRFVRAFVHGAALRSATFDAKGTRIATAGSDGVARVWDAASGRVLRELRHGGVVTSVAFSPDGTRLATAGEDAEGRVWRLPGGKLLGKLVAHEDDVLSIAFSPDGKQLVTASLDADARLWNASTFGMCGFCAGHTAVVSDAAFSSDGRWIATAGPTTVGLWDPRDRPADRPRTPGLLRAWARAARPQRRVRTRQLADRECRRRRDRAHPSLRALRRGRAARETARAPARPARLEPDAGGARALHRRLAGRCDGGEHSPAPPCANVLGGEVAADDE